MSCTVYVINLDFERRYKVGFLRSHTEMSDFLRENGNVECIYEIWKGANLHSRWKWKEKKGRWGRMSTPSKKVITT